MEMKIKFKVTNVDQPTWVAEYWVEGKRVRRSFKTEAEAREHEAQFNREEKAIGQEWAAMPKNTKLAYQLAMAEIDAAGLTLAEVWQDCQSWRAQQKAKSSAKQIKLGAAVDAYILHLSTVKRRRRIYVNAMKGAISMFAKDRTETLLSDVTPDVCRDWFKARLELDLDTKTLWNDRTRLICFFNWAIEREYLVPLSHKKPTPAHYVDLPEKTKNLIRIVSPAEATAMLETTAINEPRCLVYLVLAMFCGIRPNEIHNMTFADIDLVLRHVPFDPEKTKTGQGRYAHIPENAIAWLNLAGELGHWGAPSDRVAPDVTVIGATRREFWVPCLQRQKWQQDILRHSTASYRLKILKDCKAMVADELGNSPEILTTNYIARTTLEIAEQFYAITPAAGLLEKARATHETKSAALAEFRRSILAKNVARLAA
jgi:integrase